MAFDPTAFESLEALNKEKAKEESDTLRDIKYSNPEVFAAEKRSLAESFGFKPFQDPTLNDKGSNNIVDGEEENPDALVLELDGVSQGEGDETLVGKAGDDTLGGEEEKTGNNISEQTGVEENGNSNDVKQEENRDGTDKQSPKADGEKSNETQIEGKEKNDTTPDEHPASPFIERLGNSVLPEIKRDWKKELDAGNSFPDIVKKSNISESLKNSITSSWEAMNTPAGKEKMQADFQEDFGEKCNAALASDGEMSPGDEELIKQIGENYMKGADTTPEGQEQALNMALKTTINKEVFGKQCDKNAMVYTKNMQRINTPSLPLKERLFACKKVKMYVNRDQGAKAERYEDIADMIDDADMTAEYQEAQKALEIAQAQNNPQEIQVAQENISELIQEASELTGTPIGTFDTAIETGKSETPTESVKTA